MRTDFKKGLAKEIGITIKSVAVGIAPVLGVLLLKKYGGTSSMNVKVVNENEHDDDYSNVGYADAVKAITTSGMSSIYQNYAIKALKKGETSEYYRSVIAIAGSDASSMYIVDMIKAISKQ